MFIGGASGSSSNVNQNQSVEDSQAAAEAARAAADAARAEAERQTAEAEAARARAEVEAQTHSDGHSSFEATNPFQQSPTTVSSAAEQPAMPSAPANHDPDSLYEQIAAEDHADRTGTQTAVQAPVQTAAAEEPTTPAVTPEVPAPPQRRPEEEREIALRRAAREVSEGKVTFEDLDRHVAEGTMTATERDRVRDDGVAQWQAQQDREAAAASAKVEREQSALADRVSHGEVTFEQLDEMVATGALSRGDADKIGQEGSDRWKARTEADFVEKASQGQLSDEEVAGYVQNGHFTQEQIQGLRDEGAQLAERRADNAIVGDLSTGALSQEALADKVKSGELTQEKADKLLESASNIWQRREDNKVIDDLASGALSQEALAAKVTSGELTQEKADKLLETASAIWQGREDDKKVGDLAEQVSRGDVSFEKLNEMVQSGELTQELADRARDEGVGLWRERTANEMVDKLVTGEASHDDLMRMVDEGHFTKDEAAAISEVAGEEWRQHTAEDLVDRMSRGEVTDDEIAGFVKDGHFTDEQVGKLREIAGEVKAEREAAEALALAEAEAAAAAGLGDDVTGPTGEEAPQGVQPLTEEEAGQVGTGLKNGRADTQAFWSQQGVETTRNRALEQGLIDRTKSEANGQLARDVLLAEGTDPKSEAAAMTTGDLAAIARESGIGVERLDLQQLQNATRYVNGAKDKDEQASRLQNALDQLHMVDQGKKPKFTRDDVKGMAWDAARVGGHAIDKLKDNEIQNLAGDLASKMNTPGDHKIKVGKHDVKFTVDADKGYVDGSGSTKGTGGLLNTLKTVGKVALAAASFIPGPVGIAARIASGVIGAISAAKSGSVLGAIASAAGAVAGVAGQFGGKIAESVARVAESVGKGLKAIESAKGGGISGIIGAGAGILGAAASAVGKSAQNVANSLKTWGDRVGDAAKGSKVVESTVRLNQAVGRAEKALDEAKKAGDAGQIAAAEKALEAARKARNNGIFDSVSTGLTLASGHVGGGAARDVLRTGAQGTTTTRAIVNRDIAAAIQGGFNTAAAVETGRANSAERGAGTAIDRLDVDGAMDRQSTADGRRALAERLTGIGKDAGAVARGTQTIVTTQRTVRAAEQALEEAKKSGDADAIAAAEKALGQAERALRTSILDVAGLGLDAAARQTKGDTNTALGVIGDASRVARGINQRDIGGAIEAGFGGAARVEDARGQTDVATRLRTAGTDSNTIVQATQTAVTASRGLRAAEQALEEAKKSGDESAIKDAREAVRAAEQQLRGAILGVTGAGLDAATHQTSGRVNQVLGTVGAANGTAGAINNRDVAGALQGGFNTAGAAVRASARATEEAKKKADAQAKVLEELGVSSNEITTATRGVVAANRAVNVAEQALEAAKKTGDNDAIAAAQKNLGEAERKLRTAILGATNAGIDAAQRHGNDGVDRVAAVLDRANETAGAINDRNIGGALQGGFNTAGAVARGTAGNTPEARKKAEAVAKVLEGLGASSNEVTVATQRVMTADRARGAANAALEVARNTGSTNAIVAAERAVDLAERNFRNAVLGATNAAIDATHRHGNAAVRRVTDVLDRANDTARAINNGDVPNAAGDGYRTAAAVVRARGTPAAQKKAAEIEEIAARARAGIMDILNPLGTVPVPAR